MVGTPYRNLRTFGELCGDNAMKKVVLVTTMRDKVQQDTGVRREKVFVDNYWKTMIKYCASTARFYNSADSARKIVEIILKQHETEVLLLAEQARGESNPDLARELEAECKCIQKDLDKKFSEIKKLKIPFGKKFIDMNIFGKKSRGVRLIFKSWNYLYFVLIDLHKQKSIRF